MGENYVYVCVSVCAAGQVSDVGSYYKIAQAKHLCFRWSTTAGRTSVYELWRHDCCFTYATTGGACRYISEMLKKYDYLNVCIHTFKVKSFFHILILSQSTSLSSIIWALAAPVSVWFCVHGCVTTAALPISVSHRSVLSRHTHTSALPPVIV